MKNDHVRLLDLKTTTIQQDITQPFRSCPNNNVFFRAMAWPTTWKALGLINWNTNFGMIRTQLVLILKGWIYFIFMMSSFKFGKHSIFHMIVFLPKIEEKNIFSKIHKYTISKNILPLSIKIQWSLLKTWILIYPVIAQAKILIFNDQIVEQADLSVVHRNDNAPFVGNHQTNYASICVPQSTDLRCFDGSRSEMVTLRYVWVLWELPQKHLKFAQKLWSVEVEINGY